MSRRRVASMLLVVLALAGPAGAHASRSGPLEHLNRARAKAGRPPLRPDAPLTRAATRHAAAMAADDTLSSAGLVASPEVRSRRGRLSAMVGVGVSAKQVVDQLLTSSFHRRALLGSFRVAGVGTAYGRGRIWVAVVVASSSSTARRAQSAPRRTAVPVARAPGSAARVASPASPSPEPYRLEPPTVPAAAPSQSSSGIFIVAGAAIAACGAALARTVRRISR